MRNYSEVKIDLHCNGMMFASSFPTSTHLHMTDYNNTQSPDSMVYSQALVFTPVFALTDSKTYSLLDSGVLRPRDLPSYATIARSLFFDIYEEWSTRIAR